MWSGNWRGYRLVHNLVNVVQLHLPQKYPWSADSHSCNYACEKWSPTGKQIGPESRGTVSDMNRASNAQCSNVNAKVKTHLHFLIQCNMDVSRIHSQTFSLHYFITVLFH
jgi:hypothetical protein